MLEARDLSFTVDHRRLFADVSFTLEAGELRVLFGPSGSGKSTLIRILAGFESSPTGGVWLDGTPMEEMPPQEWRRRVVLLHQEPEMFPGSVRENLTAAARYHDLAVDPEDLLRRFDLGADPNQEARSLSGGEKKRLAFARALSVQPQFLLLDEPSASVDESTREVLDELMLSLRDDEGLGLLVVTHNPREVEKLGREGFSLEDGTFERLASRDREGERA